MIQKNGCIKSSVELFVNDLLSGIDIVRKALRIPCYTIAHNAGVDAQEVVTRVMMDKQDMGYDAMNGVYVDMIKAGIIDPTKVCNYLKMQW